MSFKFLALSLLCLGVFASNGFCDVKEKESVLDHKVKSIDGETVNLADYKGKVLLVVNVASKCGYTPQYKGLEALYEQYHDKGLAVLGFPCNQFGKQEQGSDADIKEFCSSTYKVTFDMFSKIDVNDENASPLYKQLTSVDASPKGAGPVKWNFEKFVIGKDGQVLARFPSSVAPSDPELVKVIESALAAN